MCAPTSPVMRRAAHHEWHGRPLTMMALVAVLLWPRPTVAAPVPVHLVEGVTHGFLVLRTVTGVAIGCGTGW